MLSVLAKYRREREGLLHEFEVEETLIRTTRNVRHKVDHARMVKSYSRSAAGKASPSSVDLRPPEVLKRTVDYLLDNPVTIASRPWYEVYDFVFDRLRSVRQDMVIQDIGGQSGVEILEKIIRFHIYAGYRLCTYPIAMFDAKVNNTHTQECLKRLLCLYDDADSFTGLKMERLCHHREEFECIYLLFNLGDAEALRHYYSLPESLRKKPMLKTAYDISIAYMLGNFVRLFRLMKGRRLSILCQCTVHRHFTHIYKKSLCVMNTAYSHKVLKFPLAQLTNLLTLAHDKEMARYCQACGIHVSSFDDHPSVSFQRNKFLHSAQLPEKGSVLIQDRLDTISLPDLLKGVSYPQISSLPSSTDR